jgi:hypothetical protein
VVLYVISKHFNNSSNTLVVDDKSPYRTTGIAGRHFSD